MLGSTGRREADDIPADDAVTSLDMCVGCDCLVAGHASGRVLLWDYLRYRHALRTVIRRWQEGFHVLRDNVLSDQDVAVS